MKDTRHEAITKIIKEQDIDSQRSLIIALKKMGYTATQATISRDIKELCLVKEVNANGKSRYVASVPAETRDYASRLRVIFRECVISSDYAGNMVVVKTLPGLASAASAAVDSMGARDVVGTIAGDDTVFIAMKNNSVAVDLNEQINQMIK